MALDTSYVESLVMWLLSGLTFAVWGAVLRGTLRRIVVPVGVSLLGLAIGVVVALNSWPEALVLSVALVLLGFNDAMPAARRRAVRRRAVIATSTALGLMLWNTYGIPDFMNLLGMGLALLPPWLTWDGLHSWNSVPSALRPKCGAWRGGASMLAARESHALSVVA